MEANQRHLLDLISIHCAKYYFACLNHSGLLHWFQCYVINKKPDWEKPFCIG